MRRAARELLILIVGIAAFVALSDHGTDPYVSDHILWGLLVAIVAAPIIWLAYRFVRFAIGR